MVETARLAGFDRVIGFDMGGTSTDVAHYAGTYERSFETQIAGVRLAVPMLRVHTVAAGGGSIISFDGSRFRVGPESAGANPGPKSYRRGGPLTVTDANVMVGKLDPAFFPAIFGAGGDEPLDAAAVQSGFAELASVAGDKRSARGNRRRLHSHRGREHGQCHQENLGRARLRRDGLRPQLLWFGRRTARVFDRRHAGHRDRAHSPAVEACFRLTAWDSPCCVRAASARSRPRSTRRRCD